MLFVLLAIAWALCTLNARWVEEERLQKEKKELEIELLKKQMETDE